MASTTEGRSVTLAKQRSQLRLARTVQAQSVALWRLLDLLDLDGSTPAWLSAQAQVVLAGRRAAAIDAARQYNRYRLAEIAEALPEQSGLVVVGDALVPASVIAADRTVTDKILTSLRVVGPVKVKQSRLLGRTGDRAMRDGLAAVQAAVQRHVLDGGRDSELGLMRSDPKVDRYARVTDGKACSFCGMLAGRGAVYVSESSADFAAHDSCGCSAEAILQGTPYTPPAGTSEWESRWYEYADTGDRLSPAGFARWVRANAA
jgi:hypothetical protein